MKSTIGGFVNRKEREFLRIVIANIVYTEAVKDALIEFLERKEKESADNLRTANLQNPRLHPIQRVR